MSRSEREKGARGERECVELSFFVRGTPAPQGSKRHVGKGIMVESSAKVKPWREAVKWAAIEAMREQSFPCPIDGPAVVRLFFNLPKPKSIPKREQVTARPHRKPDLDKLVRSTLDGLTDGGVWVDDARVCTLDAVKAYAVGPIGVSISVQAMAP